MPTSRQGLGACSKCLWGFRHTPTNKAAVSMPRIGRRVVAAGAKTSTASTLNLILRTPIYGGLWQTTRMVAIKHSDSEMDCSACYKNTMAFILYRDGEGTALTLRFGFHFASGTLWDADPLPTAIPVFEYVPAIARIYSLKRSSLIRRSGTGSTILLRLVTLLPIWGIFGNQYQTIRRYFGRWEGNDAAGECQN